MKSLKSRFLLVGLVLYGFCSGAFAQTIWHVDDDLLDFPAADFRHPQDAVNAASPGDTILIHPGLYRERTFRGGIHTTPDYASAFITVTYATAPPLIVYKDNLTIKSANGKASTTIIQSDYRKYCEPVAVQASTGGVWDGFRYRWAGVNPTSLTANNAVSIIASNVTISNLTIRSSAVPVDWSASVMIGALDVYFDSDFTDDFFFGRSNNNVINSCVLDDSTQHIGILVFHSRGNTITKNYVDNSSSSNESAIELFDGFSIADVLAAPGSKYNTISYNSISKEGAITIGARLFLERPAHPAFWTDNVGTMVIKNKCKAVDTFFSKGRKTYISNIVRIVGVVVNSIGIVII